MSGQEDSGTRAVVETRLRAIRDAVDRELPPHPPVQRTPRRQHDHLFEEAKQLYENELNWEEETGEEFTESGTVVALVFPGTLALVDALLSPHASSEEVEGMQHRDVVVSLLEWLADRLFDLRSGQTGGSATERAKQVDLADRLMDLILYRYCGLTGEEVERVDASRN